MLVAVADLPSREIALVAGVVAVLSMADALRLHSPRTALGASLAVPVAIGAFVHSTGLTTAETGVALTVTAVVLAGLGSLLGREWIVPVLGGVAVAAGGGLLLSSGDPTRSPTPSSSRAASAWPSAPCSTAPTCCSAPASS